MRELSVAVWSSCLAFVGGCGQATMGPSAPTPPAQFGPGQNSHASERDAGVAFGERDASVVDATAHDALGADTQAHEAPLDAATGDSAAGATISEAAPTSSPCPEGMQLVDTSYCPRIERRCIDEEYSPQNHITICHKYAPAQRCLVPEEHRRFCIDTYEYPNRKGAHPPWMVSWYDAQATCETLGKRTCYESEWVAACEGPAKTPFPYGRSRDNAKCNIDNTWISPHLAQLYRSDESSKLRELSRLDQSAPSGAMSECVSGFGVHDMTGNFDEWVTADDPHGDKSEWAALKGGGWGHVRNACRPVTTSHPPDFTYYFITFRCCADAAGSPPYVPKRSASVPIVPPAQRAPVPNPLGAPGPSPIKVGRDVFPRPGKSAAPVKP